MVRLLLLCAALMILLNGCTAYRNDNLVRLQTLPQHYEQFDVKLAWEVKSTDSTLVIDGVVKNIRYYLMNDFEIWVWTLDEQGRELQRSVAFVNSLKENETGQFTIKLPKVASGSKLQFVYRYTGHEGGGESGNAATWSQSFVAEVP